MQRQQTTHLAQNKPHIPSVIAASSGNLVEWFDFYIYGFAAVYFAHNFSNATSPLLAQIEVFGVFAAGFLMLPIGSIIFGKIADRDSRKKAMIISILCMAFGSFFISFLPSKSSIGDSAIMLLLLARLLQGIAVGGEFGIVAAYLSEVSPSGKRSFYSSFQYATIIGGQLFAVASISFLFMLLDEAQMRDFGWRILFFAGGVLGLLSLAFRRFMRDDCAQVLQLCDERGSFKALAKSYKSLLLVIGITAGCTIGFYTITTYPKIYMINNGISSSVANNIMLIALFVLCVAIPLVGALSDKIGFKTSLRVYLGFCIIGIYPLFLLMGKIQSVFILCCIASFMCFMLSFYTAVAAISKTTLFPAHIRALGTGLGAMISVGVFGGSVNYVALQFKAHNMETGFFVYFGVFALISLICVGLIPKKRELD